VDIERLRPVILIEVETKVAFADVVGVEDGKVELKEVVECSRTPKATVASPAKPCWRARFRRGRCHSSRCLVRFRGNICRVGAARMRDLFE
jgi:hypothetical protein